MVSKLLVLLADRDRMVLLPEIASAYEARLMDEAQVVRAEVTTAVALPADRISQLQHGLARATGRQVQLETRIDPSIIGGLIVKLGSRMVDSSLRTKLNAIKHAMKEVS